MNPQGQSGAPIPLADAVRKKVQETSLEPFQLQRLQGMQQAVLEQPAAGTPAPRTAPYRALAACVAVLLCTVLLWLASGPGSENPARSIALEVATNHLKLKPLDISSRSMGELRQFFTQLDFFPVSPAPRTTTSGLGEDSLLGGRYCSIRGVTAAQLRYQVEGNDLQTLYQVAYDPQLHGAIPAVELDQPPLAVEVKGLRVFLWREKGLLMALVSPP